MTRKNAGVLCAVGTTLELIGGKWKPIIIWHLLQGKLRYGELQRIITAATPKMLTQQLRELEEDGLLIRTVYPVVPPKVEYELSKLGHSLKPVLQTMCDWGEAYKSAANKKTKINSPHRTAGVSADKACTKGK